MSTTFILLQGGTVLIHDENSHIVPTKVDLLIEGKKIARIGANISPPAGTEVINCVDKIISPGFIDTHHHVWQTLLKGRHANQMLLDYMPDGNFTSSLHEEADFYWGELAGCLECLDVGTTTVVDHAHLNYSAKHTKAAIAATIASGIRSVFCYCPPINVSSWSPLVLSQDMLADWVMTTFEELASKSPFGNGRIQLGLGFDGLWLPKEVIAGLFAKAKGMGVKIITLHAPMTGFGSSQSVVQLLSAYDLLDSSILISHHASPSQKDADLLIATNSHLSSTPSTELQMNMGQPAAFNSKVPITAQCSIGIDCHSLGSASIPSELKLLLQNSRGTYNQSFVEAGKVPNKANKTVEEAFNLGTIGGAKAIGMQSQIGTLKEGYAADILVWDALTPSMICAAQQDPVAAIILHSSPADLDTVIVDGIVRKQGGKLVDVDTKVGEEIWSVGAVEGRGETVGWKDVSRELVKRREVLHGKIEKIDMVAAKKDAIKAFYIDESLFVDSV